MSEMLLVNPAVERRAPRKGGALWGLALAALVLLNVFLLLRWVGKDTKPTAWDQAIHVRCAYDYRDRLHEGFNLGRLMRPAFFNYPPLYHLAMIPALASGGDPADSGAKVNVFALAALLVAIYVVAADLLGPAPALAAAAVFSAYPIVLWTERETMIDLALTTWVALAFWALVRSRAFRRWPATIAFGVTLGLGLLTKWTMPGYLVGPLVVPVIVALRERRWAPPLVAFAIAAAMASVWYIPNTFPALIRINHLTGMVPANGVEMNGLWEWLWYPRGMIEQMNLPLLALFLVGFVVSWKRPELRPVLVWFVASFFVFSLIRNRNIRYTLPALPAAAILSVSWLRGRRWAAIAVTSAAVLLLVAENVVGRTIAFSIGSQSMPFYQADAPQVQNWRHDDIINAVRALKPAGRPVAQVLVAANVDYFHSTSMNITARSHGYDDIDFHGPAKHRWLEFADFIVQKTGSLGPAYTLGAVKDVADFLQTPPDWFRKTYKVVGRWSLPDGGEAILYQWKPDAERVPADLVSLELSTFEMPNVVAHDLVIRAVPISAAESARGHFKELTLRCRDVVYKTLVFSNVELKLVDPVVNVPLFLEKREIELSGLGAIVPKATVSADTLLAFAQTKAKWLKDPSLHFDGNTIRLGGRAGRFPVAIDFDVAVKDRTLRTHLRSFRLAGVPLPRILFSGATDREISLEADHQTPFAVRVAAVRGDGASFHLIPEDR